MILFQIAYGGVIVLKWKYIKTGVEGKCELFSVNIFDYEWEGMGGSVRVKDPAYGQWHSITIYRVKKDEKFCTFGAGEFSNLIWGVYLPI